MMHPIYNRSNFLTDQKNLPEIPFGIAPDIADFIGLIIGMLFFSKKRSQAYVINCLSQFLQNLLSTFVHNHK